MAFIQIYGLKEFRRALAEMVREAPAELPKANKPAANLLVVEAIRRAPTGPHEGGGKVVPITRSIHALFSSDRVTVVAGGSRSPQAAGAEFGGTIPRRGWKGRKAQAKRIANFYGGRTVTHLKRQPFLFPALDAKWTEIQAVYEQALEKFLAKSGGT